MECGALRVRRWMGSRMWVVGPVGGMWWNGQWRWMRIGMWERIGSGQVGRVDEVADGACHLCRVEPGNQYKNYLELYGNGEYLDSCCLVILERL